MMASWDPFSGLMNMGGPLDYFMPSDGGSSGGGGGGFDWTSLFAGLLNQLPVPTVPSPGTGFPMPIPGWPGPTQFPSAPQLPSRTGRIRRTTRGGVPTFRVNVFGGKRRRMNACNPRALRRAIRRVKHFEKFAKQSVRISHKVKLQKGRGRKTCR